MLSQQIELRRIVHVDAYQFARPIPQRFRQALSVGDRLVKVHRRHMEAMAFPERKISLEFSAVQTTRHDCRDEICGELLSMSIFPA